MTDPTDIVDDSLKLGDALIMLIKGVIPVTPEQVACMQKYFPVITERRLKRAQRLKEEEITQAAAWVIKHKVDPMQFALYLKGDTTFAQLVKQDVEGSK